MTLTSGPVRQFAEMVHPPVPCSRDQTPLCQGLARSHYRLAARRMGALTPYSMPNSWQASRYTQDEPRMINEPENLKPCEHKLCIQQQV